MSHRGSSARSSSRSSSSSPSSSGRQPGQVGSAAHLGRDQPSEPSGPTGGPPPSPISSERQPGQVGSVAHLARQAPQQGGMGLSPELQRDLMQRPGQVVQARQLPSSFQRQPGEVGS